MGTENAREIFTLGTSARPLAEFIAILKSRDIKAVADVRRFPTSRFSYFRAKDLAAALAEQGIEYIPMGEELGGYRDGGYRAFTATAGFEQGLAALEDVARREATAVICAERLPWQCHRRFIALHLQERGWSVRHIIDRENECLPGQGLETR